jgi:NAD(P)-dependent dehydrogenase (short-subunit alcohol dehydrogenase family)
MLGFVTIAEGFGAADRLLAATAEALLARGLRLAGAVQHNLERGGGRECDMQLRILGTDAVIGISQDLGSCAQGCRLDGGALAQAVALAETALARGADLVIVNKFGRQEGLGGGFRTFIAEALAQDVPVLLSVAPEQLREFQDFAGELAEPVAPEAVISWCTSRTRTSA